MEKKSILTFFLVITVLVLMTAGVNIKKKDNQVFGSTIDSYNGINVYYNGNSKHIKGRNLSNDGYNFGLKYECTEFVKRYYYLHFNHKMPFTSGNAKDFYNINLKDGQRNKQRDLIQYSNSSKTKPEVDDLIIFPSNKFNHFGHVAIISKVTNNEIEVVQQNMGFSTRATFALVNKNNKWKVTGNPFGWVDVKCLGWLRKE